MKSNLASVGYEIAGNEPMKITLKPKSYGYTGYELASQLKKKKIIHEFADADHLVLMPTPEITDMELAKLEVVLLTLKKKAPIASIPPTPEFTKQVISPRAAVLSPAETIPVDNAEGRILADITVGCPPAVPIVVSGEEITASAIEAFKYYGITHCSVVK